MAPAQLSRIYSAGVSAGGSHAGDEEPGQQEDDVDAAGDAVQPDVIDDHERRPGRAGPGSPAGKGALMVQVPLVGCPQGEDDQHGSRLMGATGLVVSQKPAPARAAAPVTSARRGGVVVMFSVSSSHAGASVPALVAQLARTSTVRWSYLMVLARRDGQESTVDASQGMPRRTSPGRWSARSRSRRSLERSCQGTLVTMTPGSNSNRPFNRSALWLWSRFSHQCPTTYSGM